MTSAMTMTMTKTPTKTNTKTKTMTKTLCLKDISYAIFSKSREFKEIKYDTQYNDTRITRSTTIARFTRFARIINFPRIARFTRIKVVQGRGFAHHGVECFPDLLGIFMLGKGANKLPFK